MVNQNHTEGKDIYFSTISAMAALDMYVVKMLDFRNGVDIEMIGKVVGLTTINGEVEVIVKFKTEVQQYNRYRFLKELVEIEEPDGGEDFHCF